MFELVIYNTFDDSSKGVWILISFLITIALIFVVLYLLRKKEPFPISYIYDDNDEVIFTIYQLGSIFKVFNYIQTERTQSVDFKKWDDVVHYIKLEKNRWK